MNEKRRTLQGDEEEKQPANVPVVQILKDSSGSDSFGHGGDILQMYFKIAFLLWDTGVRRLLVLLFAG
jgi:hypothetical protein